MALWVKLFVLSRRRFRGLCSKWIRQLLVALVGKLLFFASDMRMKLVKEKHHGFSHSTVVSHRPSLSILRCHKAKQSKASNASKGKPSTAKPRKASKAKQSKRSKQSCIKAAVPLNTRKRIPELRLPPWGKLRVMRHMLLWWSGSAFVVSRCCAYCCMEHMT